MKSYDEIANLLGDSIKAWDKFVYFIRSNYDIDEVWHTAKPKNWQYNRLKLQRGGKVLVSVFVRDGYFRVLIIFGKRELEIFEQCQDEFSDTVRKIYDNEKVNHDGKWMFFDVNGCDDALIDDLIRMVLIKRKPNKKISASGLCC